MRKGRSRTDSGAGIELNLLFKSPYDWQTIIRFYQSHPIPGLERVTGDSFERVFRVGNTIGFLQVQAMVDEPQLKLRIMIPLKNPMNASTRLSMNGKSPMISTAPPFVLRLSKDERRVFQQNRIMTADPKIPFEVVSRVRRMFDLDSDPVLIANCFAQVPVLSKLCDRFPGLRLPRGWDPFETAICSILGQLVSAEQRSNLVGQIVRGYGDEITHPVSGETTRLFPRPEVLAKSDLSEVKTTVVRREAIRDFSRRVLSGAISLSEAQDLMAFRKALLETKGLGPWSAEYISLRAIGDTDAFPKTDLILKRALKLHPDLDLEPIRPWRSYAAIYLWKEFAETLSKRKKEKRT